MNASGLCVEERASYGYLPFKERLLQLYENRVISIYEEFVGGSADA